MGLRVEKFKRCSCECKKVIHFQFDSLAHRHIDSLITCWLSICFVVLGFYTPNL